MQFIKVNKLFVATYIAYLAPTSLTKILERLILAISIQFPGGISDFLKTPLSM
jgi:hypothetical protein